MLGQQVTDPNALLASRLQQSDSAMPRTSLAPIMDASVSAPGVPLEFSRAFIPSLTQRNTVGPLGRGWVFEWDISAITDANGNVTVRDAGKYRSFSRQSDGSYKSVAGDKATLTLVGGAYRLTESDGSVTAFRADGRAGY